MAMGFVGTSSSDAADTAALTPEFFDKSIRPLLNDYCLKCHSTEKHKGDLDLEHFSSFSEVKRHPKVWQTVAEQLANNEMPPKEKPQPSSTEKERLSKWVHAVLDDIARERAGDPGPVVLRRLSNAEYTYTIRDLTGVETLDPAREFPVDGAAGEGFMNTGQALVMSPSLITKYLEAGKEIASHAVLLPDGIRFSPKTTRRDWTEQILAEIREFYREFTDPRGGAKVNLQGIVFETNEGGRLPLEKYFAAALDMAAAGFAPASEQGTVPSGKAAKTSNAAEKPEAAVSSETPPSLAGRMPEAATRRLEAVARERGLSARYLGALLKMLSGHERSLLLDGIRARWRSAKPADAAALAADVTQWQKALWKFSSVGHIGKAGGPKAWMEPVNPLGSKQEVRLKIPVSPDDKEVTLYLVASDAGDGNENDSVVWEQPRIVAPGRPNLMLRDVREVIRELTQRRERTFATAAKSLEAAAEANSAQGKSNVSELARKHGLEAEALAAWLDYLGIGSGSALKIEGCFTNTFMSASGYDFIKGWGGLDTPNLAANSSDQHVRIPGNMKPHSVAVHPSPKLQAAVGWRSPMAATLRVEAKITHAHPECGNGVTWSLELRRGATRQRLATGTAQGSKEVKVGPLEDLAVQVGDFISLLVGPRDGNHSCDLTAVDLALTSSGEGGREWNLAKDVSPDVLMANPHADRFGNDGVWHFYTEQDKGGSETGPVIPAGSLLAKWQSASSTEGKRRLAEEVQKLLTSSPPSAKDSPDAVLYRQLASFGGPLFTGRRGYGVREQVKPDSALTSADNDAPDSKAPSLLRSAGTVKDGNWALDPAQFGRHPNGTSIDAASLCVRAPSVVEIRLPADLVGGCEFVTTGALDQQTGVEGSVQLQVLTTKPEQQPGLLPSALTVTNANGMWTSDNQRISHATPIVVNEGSKARRRFESDFDEFRSLFPAALCYIKIVPVDEVVTLTLFYREDDHLARLMLDEAQKAKLDRLWDELHYISHDALTLVDAFEQLWQYATQDADPKVFEPMRKPINDRAATFQQRLLETQPKHLDALLEFANRAYRRPLTDSEKAELRKLYRKLREQDLAHDEAIRLTLARVLVAPSFLYRAETPWPGSEQVPVNDSELASRLSYFLWSSMPDSELREVAAAGRLRHPDALAGQTRRMLRDPRVRRLATEFGCAWLHIHGFEELNEKSERHFPTFTDLRGAMYEESIRFFTDFFQRDGSVLNILDADYTFLNEALAKHYDIPGVTGAEWRRVDGVKKFSRGGILGQATTLAKQSGASRTSPILRGNWVTEVLLGDKLPRPPKDVPRLPEDETATEGLTVRQLVEKHSSDPKCSGCHARMDPYGYALEGFDAIGRHRDKDLGDRLIDTRVKAMDGAEFDGIGGLRDYLLTKRRDAFVRQFCRKLLGYSLGRTVQLSDGPLLTEMRSELEANGYRVGAAIETIVRSRQFREIRGREMTYED
jgi:hypothetical protein